MVGTLAERAVGHAAELLELAGDALLAAQEVRLDIQPEWDAYEAARIAHERVCRLVRAEQVAPALESDSELALVSA